jgi:hypothetical protein
MTRICICILLVPAICLGASIVQTFSAPDSDISGLGYGGGSLWAVDGTSQYVYGIDPSTGSVTSSFLITSLYSDDPYGLAYMGGTLYVTMVNGYTSGRVYKYSTAGAYQGNFDAYC